MFKALKEKVSNEYEKAKVNIQSQALNLVNNGTINSLTDKIGENKSINTLSQIRQKETSSLDLNSGNAQHKFSEPEFSLVDLDEENDRLKPLSAPKKEVQTISNEDSFFKTKFSNFVNNFSNFVPQSDIESEYESESSASHKNLDNVSKEQLIDLCYHLKERGKKYRERWTEVVKAYRETIEEKDKLKNVLTETQDKAIRRMNELKEQCNLEQEAKRHLEENLRVVIEEKEEQIKVLQKQFEVMNVDKNVINCEHLDSNEKNELISKAERLESLLSKCSESLKSNKEKLDIVMKENESLLMYKDEAINLKEEVEKIKRLKDSVNDSFVEAKQKLHDELESRKIIIKELKDQLDKRNIEIKQKNSEIKTKNENLKILNEKLNRTEQNFEKEKSNIIEEYSNSNKKQIKQIKDEHLNKINLLKSDFQSQINHLCEENKSLKEYIKNKSNDELKKKNEELMELIETKNIQIESLEKQISLSKNKELDSIKDNFESTESTEELKKDEEIRFKQSTLDIENLTKQTEERDDIILETVKNRIEQETDSGIREIQNRIEKLDEELIQKINYISQLEKIVAEKDLELISAKKYQCDLVNEIKQLKQISLENDTIIKQLKSECDEFEKSAEVTKKLIEKYQDEKNSLEEINRSLQEVNNHLNDDKVKLKEEVSLLNSEFKNKLLDVFQNEFSELQIDDIHIFDYNQLFHQVGSIFHNAMDENIALKEKINKMDEVILDSTKNLETKHKIQIESLQSDKENLKKELEQFKNIENSQIEELKDRETFLNGEISRLKNEIKDFKKELKIKSNQIQEQSQFLIQIQENLAKKDQELLGLKQQLNDNSQSNSDVEKLEDQLKSYKSQIEQLNCEMNELNKQNSLYLEEISKIKSNAKEILESKHKLKDTFQKSESQLKSTKNELQQLQNQNKSLLQRIDELTMNLETSLQDKLKIEKNVNALKELIDFKEKYEEEMESKIAELENQMVIFTKENDSRDDTIKNVHEGLKKSQDRCMELEEKLKSRNVCEQELRTEVIALEEKLKSSIKNEKDLKEELKINEEVNNSLKEQLQKLKTEMKELKLTMESMKSKHEETIESLYKQLEIRESQLDESLMNATAQHNSTNQELIKSRNEVSKLKAQIDELNLINKELENKFKITTESNNSQMNKIIKQYENQIESLQSKLEEKKQEITEKMDQFDNIENRLINEHRGAISQLKNEISEKNTALEEVHEYYQQRLKAKDSELKHLHEQLTCTDRNNYQINALQNSILQYHEENLRLKELLNMQQERNNEHNRNNSDIENCAILGIHLPQPTEYEYLRNILFEFMIGREPVTLAKVIAAVMRFNNEQTEQIIRRQESIHSSSIHRLSN